MWRFDPWPDCVDAETIGFSASVVPDQKYIAKNSVAKHLHQLLQESSRIRSRYNDPNSTSLASLFGEYRPPLQGYHVRPIRFFWLVR